jgi:PAS domain S-box-containing protein
LREAGKLTLKALTESEEKFRMLTEKSNALICELDLEGRILYANSKFSEHLGYDPQELEGHAISENCLPEMQQNFFDSIVHFFPNPTFKNEWYLKDKKGFWHWFRCHTSAFVNAKGEERRSVILFEISDIKQVEEQLKRYTRDLKELNATKDKFFGIIAHDLKNPFTSLLGASELLINSLENFDQETVKHIGLLLYDSAKRGYTLLQNLLEWSRSQSGTITFNPKPLPLKQVVLENISSIQISAFNKKQQIICDISHEMEISADQNMLNTILRNLLQNAIKFSSDGEKIVLKAHKNDRNEITIVVKDSGIGIAEENLKKLFRLDEKFTNLGTRNEQGTGLGLILCKEFVEKHKGRIWVESKIGKGSKFSFTIPQ